jgi:drug/metabolite transporter (DMT)-like permease
MLYGILAGLAAGALWGLVFIAPRALPDVGSSEVALGRYVFFAVGALISLPLMWRNVRSVLSGERLAMGFLLSLLGYSLYYVLLVGAVREAGITVSSLIIGLLPVTIALGSREKVRRKGLFRSALALIILGVLLLNLEGLRSMETLFPPGSKPLKGVMLSFLALACWTSFAVLNSRYLKRHRINSLAWGNLLGILSCLGILIWILLTGLSGGLPAWTESQPILRHYLIWSAVLGLGATWLATWLWNRASHDLPTSLSGQLIVSETVFALLFGFIWESRLPTFLEGLSIVTLICGVLVGISAFRPVKEPLAAA